MSIAIYEEVGTGRKHWAESTSPTTKALLATGAWVLFDSTPDTPPPASSSDALGHEMAERVPGFGPFALALRGAFGRVDDALNLRRLADLAASDRQKSLAAARVAYEDAPVFVETWANLSGWTLAATPGLQINGGKVYANGSAGSSGATRAWPLGTTGTGRAVINFNRAGGGGGGVIIGVSKDAAGAVPAVGAGNAKGIYLRNGGNVTQSMNEGAVADLGQGATTDGPHIVTVTVDAAYISIVATKVDGSIEQRVKFPRAGFNIQTLYIFNSDTNQLTGSSIGALGARQATATVAPRLGVEGVARTVAWTSIGNTGIRVALPAGFDSRVPSPVLLAFHGNGSDETHFASNANGKAVADAFLNAGYVVVSAAYSPGVSTWGAQPGLDAYVDAYRYLRDRFTLGPVVLYGNSMGGLESLLTLAERRIPGIACWVGTVPGTNLAASHANAAFTGTIRTAYGIAGDGSDYTAKTSGHDPQLKPGYAFRGLPMWVLVATDDTAIVPADNWNQFEAVVQPYAAEYVRVNATGGHSTGAIASNTGAMVAFANKHV